ncbi:MULTISPECIES: hypothetical protein [unclassified Enterococcus]|uniref:CD3337/EF1877 family mobilome membrane protein n=1 Tax=unclassified Enterococcus TaxID=2608891 RepID=UPI002473127D|nr:MULTISPECIES: hypothetical protein [unclassified Enterococcus]
MVAVVAVIFMLASVGTVVHATGLVDDTINTANEYSKYGLSNYQLDFYVDNSWGWLPWNWSDGLGKSVMYGLYAITNFIWTISLYLSNATGYLVQEAYSLDFVGKTADSIGKNIQTIAGVTRAGFSSSGFYVGFLLILILVLGIYVAYTGLLKRETTKAVRAVLNFVVVFIVSASFIAYAPDYIGKINDFSKDVSNASLDVGTKIVLPDTNSQGKDSVDMIRDSLFSVQVKQPWLLLQFGSTDVDALGADRVESLLSTSPDTNNGEDREDIVIEEIEDKDNKNLTITNTISRLGTVFFLFIFNIGISIFVFLLTGIMIFSQVLFIIFTMFLPISFLLSMIPSFEGMSKRVITKLFNVIMTRAGITLIITVAFSISTMLYSISASSPFFMIMFLQIVTFAGIYFKLGDIMSMFALQGNDSQNVGRRMFRRPRMFMNRQARKLQRSVNHAIGKSPSSKSPKDTTAKTTKANLERTNDSTAGGGSTTRRNPAKPTSDPRSMGQKAGEKTGQVMDIKNRVVDKAKDMTEQVKNAPTNVKYALHKGKRDLVQNASDFTQSVTETRKQKQEERAENRNQKRANLAQKRLELDKAKQATDKTEPMYSMRQRQYKRDYENRNKPVPTTTDTRTKPATTESKPTRPVTATPPTPKTESTGRTPTISRENGQVDKHPPKPPVIKNRPSDNWTTTPKESTRVNQVKENQSTTKQTTRMTKKTTTRGRKK